MKYREPKSVPVPATSGYPQSDIGKTDVTVKGKYPEGTGQKKYSEVRGAGAASKGKKFLTP